MCIPYSPVQPPDTELGLCLVAVLGSTVDRKLTVVGPGITSISQGHSAYCPGASWLQTCNIRVISLLVGPSLDPSEQILAKSGGQG